MECDLVYFDYFHLVLFLLGLFFLFLHVGSNFYFCYSCMLGPIFIFAIFSCLGPFFF